MRPECDVIGFAHRGAPQAAADQNTLAAFRRALDLGAKGLESDIWLTADGVPVLIHIGLSVGGRAKIAQVTRSELPSHIPSLCDLYDSCGTDFELALDMANPQAAEAVMRIAMERKVADRLWLTYWRLPTLALWRDRWPELRLVYPSLPIVPGAVGRLLAKLALQRVDVLNVHHRFCTANLSDAVHSAGPLLFAWGIKSRRALERVLAHNVDGVFCDDVMPMVDVLNLRRWGP